jgi:SAM-dependent methyltransferase
MRLLFTPRWSVNVSVHKHDKRLEDFPPNCEPYQGIGRLWSQTAGRLANLYDPFLRSASRYYAVPIRSVLDLACGTGVLVRSVAGWAECVVGLDASDAMLREARSQTTNPNVRCVHGDFKSFRLNETFDAVICSGDSINYLQTPGELVGLLGRVRDHLIPGGLFAFDVLDHRRCTVLTHLKTVVTLGSERFEIYYFYDPKSRVSESRGVIGKAIERHRRIPIDEDDVYGAAGKARLDVVASFSLSRYLTRFVVGRQYYVLRKSRK